MPCQTTIAAMFAVSVAFPKGHVQPVYTIEASVLQIFSSFDRPEKNPCSPIVNRDFKR
jgi:hypothetical protein